LWILYFEFINRSLDFGVSYQELFVLGQHTLQFTLEEQGTIKVSEKLRKSEFGICICV